MRDNSPVFHWVILFLFVAGMGWMTYLVEPKSDTVFHHPGSQTIPQRVIKKITPPVEVPPVVETNPEAASQPPAAPAEAWE